MGKLPTEPAFCSHRTEPRNRVPPDTSFRRMIGYQEVSDDASSARDPAHDWEVIPFPRLQYWHAVGSLSGTRGSL